MPINAEIVLRIERNFFTNKSELEERAGVFRLFVFIQSTWIHTTVKEKINKNKMIMDKLIFGILLFMTLYISSNLIFLSENWIPQSNSKGFIMNVWDPCF